MTLKRLDNLLKTNANDGLENLLQRAQKMDDLTASLKTSLRGVDPGEIVAANLRDDGDLVVVCRSSAWAARLRFESEQLLFAARSRGYPATRVRVRVHSQFGDRLPDNNAGA